MSICRVLILTFLTIFLSAGPLLAAGQPGLDVPLWTSTPFVLLLLAIALLPLMAEHFWQYNRNKALVGAILSAPVVIYLFFVGQEGMQELFKTLEEYAAFIILLGSLYTVSGGILLTEDLEARPITNTAFLALGCALANIIGTTGASMLLIRPVLQINKERQRTKHLPVFFIFLVSNLGGMLTPLGDPPLFLGFLNGVDFTWTFQLWPQWLVANGLVLFIFFVWDTIAYRSETPQTIAEEKSHREPLRVRGIINILFLAGILLAVILQSDGLSGSLQVQLSRMFNFQCPDLRLSEAQAEVVMLIMALSSWFLTPAWVRKAHNFSWVAIIEVAVLFAGIFITMVPALAWLKRNGPTLGVTEPWEFFWLSGGLSSFLDNAPTYLTFATMAAGENTIGSLTVSKPVILAAISCGSVFMGANTYIGNGPNFMVKAIADQAGFKTPSFFGYMLYSICILIPVFVVVTAVFFWTW